MHARWKSCNKSDLWSMQYEKLGLAYALVVIYYYYSPNNVM